MRNLGEIGSREFVRVIRKLFSERGPNCDIKLWVSEGLKVYGALKIMLNIRRVCSRVNGEMYGRF